ncbi:TetR family transcriptional regulator [Jatrophihabitans sp. GAS493]|uniref:helix-turn-helix domain-containing protein n=1 Tax=Jatrophihabitans sp. GAS493 TaxID=1907575 RepID=UPI000BB7BD77|nr:helix-turn-helix domain-containing protein [Jatrophihabitans sp. GAS493]SOD73348.1 TetR family transcriptional regulator [Jatrophihabitans sp. GAS493]
MNATTSASPPSRNITDGHAASPRRRDAADSKRRLLEAARALFAERGYDRTTVREIGRRADVDPTMIARYFGGKSALYLESVRPDGTPARVDPLDLTSPDEMTRLVDRVRQIAASPTMSAAIRPHQDPELQDAAMGVLQRLIVEPSTRAAEAAGASDAQLRAEIAAAAAAGVVLSRKSGAFAELTAADSAAVGRLLAQLCSSLLSV